jgi:hypothetical protein
LILEPRYPVCGLHHNGFSTVSQPLWMCSNFDIQIKSCDSFSVITFMCMLWFSWYTICTCCDFLQWKGKKGRDCKLADYLEGLPRKLRALSPFHSLNEVVVSSADELLELLLLDITVCNWSTTSIGSFEVVGHFYCNLGFGSPVMSSLGISF